MPQQNDRPVGSANSKADSAKGQQKTYTVTAPGDDRTKDLTLSQAAIRARREELLAAGFTGHGLTEDLDEPETDETAGT